MASSPKPAHLGAQYGAQFGDHSVVAAYQYRPPYPTEVFRILAGLIQDEPRIILDLGCGTGAIARNMTSFVDRVDALDISAEMLSVGQQLPGGDDSRLCWLHGAAEDTALDPPYALITAGASLHWMDWDVVLPRLASLLTPRGYLAITGDGHISPPWAKELQPIINRYSTNRDYQPYDLIEELQQRKLFEQYGRQETGTVAWHQPIDSYIESYHARNGFSRERMTPEAAIGFDTTAKVVVAPWAVDGYVELQLKTSVIWGKPLHFRSANEI